MDAAIGEESSKNTVCNRRTNLALDVVANDRKTGGGKLLLPLWLTTDEDWDRVHERASRLDRLLGVIADPLFAADRKVGNQDVHLALLEHCGNINRLLW